MNIGSLQLENPCFLAPMAGITDLPYRLIMKRFGASLVFTEMISANGLHFNGRATRELMRTLPEEQPVGIQLFGDSAERLAEAAREAEAFGALIDINLGCPVRKVVNAGAGSALLRDPAKVGRIVAAVRRATEQPLTIKLRSGWDRESINCLEVARIAVDAGVDAITLHPRTRAQAFGGKADWNMIKRLKEAVPVPVIGSGDVFSAADAKTMFAQTGCDALMVGRGSYGNPWLFRQIIDHLADRVVTPPAPDERYRIAREHLDLFLETFGPRKTLGQMRKHLCWYVRGLENSAGFRADINACRSVPEIYALLDEFFAEAA